MAAVSAAASCARCGDTQAALRACARCKAVKYCGRSCQSEDWKQHKAACRRKVAAGETVPVPSVGEVTEDGAGDIACSADQFAQIASMGRSVAATAKRAEGEAHKKDAKEAIKQRKQVLKQVPKAQHMHMSFTAFGPFGPGCPHPAGVPANFHLKQAAHRALLEGPSSTGRGNFKGERLYREFFDDLLGEETETWLSFFAHRGNSEHAEHSCGILGTLATIYRQRGDLVICEQVLDMEELVLTRYQQASVGASREQVSCCDRLGFMCHHIRYNLYMQTGRHTECVALFRELAGHEARNGCGFEQSHYLFMLAAILGREPDAANLRGLSDAEVLQLVKAPLGIGDGDGLEVEARKNGVVKLNSCGNCQRKEDAIGDFKLCPRCQKE